MSTKLTTNNYNYISAENEQLPTVDLKQISLSIRQQPIQARGSTNNEKDRRPVDPPPIVQVGLKSFNSDEIQHFLQNPFLFMSASLVNPNNLEFIENTCLNTISGQTTSSMYKLKDIDNLDGGYFVFGDLSIKLEGKYKLKFSMFEINSSGVKNIKSVYSETFQVYHPKVFPGMLESTFLSRSFSDQGARIRISKKHRVQMAGQQKRKFSSENEYQNNLEFPACVYDNTRLVYQKNEQQEQDEQVKIRKKSISPFPAIFDARIPVTPYQKHHDPNLTKFTEFHRQQSVKRQHLSLIPQHSPVKNYEIYRECNFENTKQNKESSRYYMENIKDNCIPFSTSVCPSPQIQLPPLRLVIPTIALNLPLPNPIYKKKGEVDEAVAMMEFTSISKSRENRNLINMANI